MAYRDECPFVEGEVVVFKSFEELESEFDVTAYGSVEVPFGFTVDMRRFCGTEHVVKSFEFSLVENEWRITFENHREEVDGYSIGAKMLKHRAPDADETEVSQIIDDADFMSIILGQ